MNYVNQYGHTDVHKVTGMIKNHLNIHKGIDMIIQK